jgi:hypothetical protein
MASYRFADEDEAPAYRFADEEKKPQATLTDKALSIGKNALMSSPLFAPMNAANLMEKAAFNAGAGVNDMAAQYVSPEVAAGLGAATNVGVQTMPFSAPASAARALVGPMRQAGRFLMNSALKPSAKQHATGQAKDAIETMLKEGYSPTESGVQQMQMEIGRLNDEIAQSIAGSPATIEKQKVVDRLQDLMTKFQMQVTPSSDVNAIKAVSDEFMAHPMAPGANIPVQLAQDMKKGTYKALGAKSYGEQKGASTEAQKALARGLKEEIAAAVPEVAPMNALESELLNAKKIAAHRVAMDANKNPLGLGALISQPWMLPLWMWDRSPAAKAATARMLYSGSEAIPGSMAGGGVLGLGMSQGEPSDPYLRGILYGR